MLFTLREPHQLRGGDPVDGLQPSEARSTVIPGLRRHKRYHHSVRVSRCGGSSDTWNPHGQHGWFGFFQGEAWVVASIFFFIPKLGEDVHPF